MLLTESYSAQQNTVQSLPVRLAEADSSTRIPWSTIYFQNDNFIEIKYKESFQ